MKALSVVWSVLYSIFSTSAFHFVCVPVWSSCVCLVSVTIDDSVPSVVIYFSILFPVFKHYYYGPTLATTNATLVLQQITEILEKAKNQTGEALGRHNGSVTLAGHAEEHALLFLPESLVLCTRERPVLCLLLMLGTLWLGYALYLIKRRYGHSRHHLTRKQHYDVLTALYTVEFNASYFRNWPLLSI